MDDEKLIDRRTRSPWAAVIAIIAVVLLLMWLLASGLHDL